MTSEWDENKKDEDENINSFFNKAMKNKGFGVEEKKENKRFGFGKVPVVPHDKNSEVFNPPKIEPESKLDETGFNLEIRKLLHPSFLLLIPTLGLFLFTNSPEIVFFNLCFLIVTGVNHLLE